MLDMCPGISVLKSLQGVIRKTDEATCRVSPTLLRVSPWTIVHLFGVPIVLPYTRVVGYLVAEYPVITTERRRCVLEGGASVGFGSKSILALV